MHVLIFILAPFSGQLKNGAEKKREKNVEKKRKSRWEDGGDSA